MPLYPHAIQRGPIPSTNFAPNGDPKIGLAVHVSQGSAQSALSTFSQVGAQKSSHLIVDTDGTPYQILDTDLCCYAQAAGNYPPTAYIAVEFAGFDTDPMTNAQILTGAAILAWASSTHFFPIVGPVAHGSPGVIPHCNPDGTPDSNYGGHTCPGFIRLAQIPGMVYIAWLVQHPPTPPASFPKASTNMAVDVPTGGYLVTRPDGSVFNFGGALFHGSAGCYDPSKPPGGSNVIKLSAPIVGIAPTRTGLGYWLVGADGSVFGFGDAGYHGSAPANPNWGIGTSTNPVTGVLLDPSKQNGYILIADKGTGFVPTSYFCNEVTHYA